MKKLFKTLLVVALTAITCAALAFTGCTSSTVVSISSITLTSTEGNIDTYTISYTDGTTSTFTVTNGIDGEDGEDGADGTDGTDGTNGYTVNDLYEAYIAETGENITLAEFITQYLSVTTTTDTSLSINETLLSAVKVYCEYEYTYSTGPSFGGHTSSSSNIGTAVTYATGSGILYTKGAEYSYIVTNYHVVYEADYGGISETIHCYLYGSESEPTANYASTTSSYITSLTYDSYAIECEYIGGSASSDIAVLRVKTADIDAINSDFKPVTLSDDGYHVGETAYTIGNAEGEGLSVTEGIVSVDSEYIYLSVDGTYRYYRSIRIDTAVYSGNSGGGLFNKDGELIGLVNAGSSSDENINYAIPLLIVTGTADNIIYYYEDGDSSTEGSYTVTLGITYTTANSKYVYDSTSGYGEITEDIIISEVSDSSIAQSLGLEAGDYLKAMTITDASGNSTTYEITRSFTVTDLLLTLRPDYTISFSYLRGETTGTTTTHTITSSDLTARD